MRPAIHQRQAIAASKHKLQDALTELRATKARLLIAEQTKGDLLVQIGKLNDRLIDADKEYTKQAEEIQELQNLRYKDKQEFHRKEYSLIRQRLEVQLLYDNMSRKRWVCVGLFCLSILAHVWRSIV